MRKNIRLSENKLRNLIRETVRQTISEINYPSSDDLFDLNKIPMEVLDKGSARYHPYLFTIDHRNPLANRVIEEATDYKKQIQIVKNAILQTFPISNEQFLIMEGHHGLYAALLISLNDDNVDIIEQAMENKGFFRSQPTDNQILYDRKHRKWIDVRFEPKDPDDVTEEVHRKFSKLYHLTPKIFEKKILEFVLKVSNNNANYKYSEPRVYFSEGDIDRTEIQMLVNTLYAQAQNRGIENLSPEYTLFTFDLDKMGYKIRFFQDINEPKGLYTKVNISPQYISSRENIIAQSNDKLK